MRGSWSGTGRSSTRFMKTQARCWPGGRVKMLSRRVLAHRSAHCVQDGYHCGNSSRGHSRRWNSMSLNRREGHKHLEVACHHHPPVDGIVDTMVHGVRSTPPRVWRTNMHHTVAARPAQHPSMQHRVRAPRSSVKWVVMYSGHRVLAHRRSQRGGSGG